MGSAARKNTPSARTIPLAVSPAAKLRYTRSRPGVRLGAYGAACYVSGYARGASR